MANQLHALSPLDGRYQQRIASLHQFFSEYALIQLRIEVEVRYLLFFLEQTELVIVTNVQRQQILAIVNQFGEAEAEQVKALESQCHHDVKAIEYFLQAQCKKLKLKKLIPYLHFGLTSEDINSCAYGLALARSKKTVIMPALIVLIERILKQADQSATDVMLARTHGQSAVPTTLGKELIVFATRLENELQALASTKIEAKLNGAVGNWNALAFVLPKIDWFKFSDDFVTSLELTPNTISTQIVSAESYSRFFQILVKINLILIDCARDCWQYISDGYFVQQVVKQEVGSSTMPHKINPIDFENSEGNAGVAVALLQHFVEKLPISRLQRDLSDSTVKRSFGTGLAHSLLAINSLWRGLEKVFPSREMMKSVVQHHPEVLAEAYQTSLRLSGIIDAYEQLKAVSRDHQLSVAASKKVINLVTDPKLKKRLLQLKPENYFGLAPKIVTQEITRISNNLTLLQKESNQKGN
ncbi:MAG: adenylosuccinate lyase [Candidatus Pacebacteria bacterium CG10_big_fil_rev_8_21_14_0_10_44_11]|nr:MAG: adenylosuccinate lyase [Candidatus Pacebacteria bacterium CG10_big_fil_rev_8_21_14_0_10_44_11]